MRHGDVDQLLHECMNSDELEDVALCLGGLISPHLTRIKQLQIDYNLIEVN